MPDSVEAEATFEPRLTSASAARRFLRATLRSWRYDRPTETALLLTNELVTNALLHAGTDVAVTNLALTAGTGIGPLFVDVATLAAANTTAGAVAVSDAADLTVGTVDGLFQLRPRLIRAVTVKDGLPHNECWSVWGVGFAAEIVDS